MKAGEQKGIVKVKKNISICFGDEHVACCVVNFRQGEEWKMLQRDSKVDVDQTELIALGNIKVVMKKESLTETFAEYFEII